MKKRIITIAGVIFLMIVMFGSSMNAFAESEDLPLISFANSDEKAYAGVNFNANVELSKNADHDIAFSVTDSNGKKSEGVIKAGEKTGKINLASPGVEREKLTYTIENGSGYSLGKTVKMEVTAYRMPKFKLGYEGLKYIKLGESFEVKIKRTSADSVVQDVVFKVKSGSENGEVVGEVVLRQWTEQATLNIEHSEKLGRNADLYVCVDQTDTVVGKLNLIMGEENDKGIRSIETDQKKIAISFDCAYNDVMVDYILDLLDEYNIKTTFFVTGFWIEAFPDTLKKVYDRGHEIGNHTLTHPRLIKLSDAEIYEELVAISDRVEEITGARPNVFRPPYGSFSARVVGIADSLGCDTALWAHDSMDWQDEPKKDYIISSATKKVKAGDIILFHAGARLTKETLPVILEYYTKELGLEVVRISDLVYDGDRTISDEGVVSPGSDYANYSGDEMFTSLTIENAIPDAAVPASINLGFQFDEGKWFLHDDEVAGVKADMSGVNIEASIADDLSNVTEGDKVGTAVFSYYGQPDITADIVVTGMKSNEVSDKNDEPAMGDDSEVLEEENKTDELSDAIDLSLAEALAGISIPCMVVAVFILIKKWRTIRNESVF